MTAAKPFGPELVMPEQELQKAWDRRYAGGWNTQTHYAKSFINLNLLPEIRNIDRDKRGQGLLAE
jgi:hypothetical protein